MKNGRGKMFPEMEREAKPEKLLDGQVAIITGAAHGIGRGIALEMAREGAKIVVADINDANAQITAQQLGEISAECLLQHTDISREEDHEKLISETLKKFGKIDILVNDAAVGMWTLKTLLKCPPQQYRNTIDTNLTGAILLTRLVAQEMIERKTRGRILFITSIHDSVIYRQPDYSVTKAGLVMFIREAAQELAPYGIRVNGIAPGQIDIDDAHVKKGVALENPVIPLGKRAGLPKDIARMAIVLTSDYWSRYTTGAICRVDGGLSDVNWLSFHLPLVDPLIPPHPEKV